MPVLVLIYILGAYLLGSISSAVLLTRIYAHKDIREQGSGNPGATNVLRVAGKKAAGLVFVFDVLKGTTPVYLGFLAGFTPLVLSLIALSACIGHMYPIFFKFKGGKGVATALGAIIPINWLLCVLVLATWLLIFAISRVSSIAAIVTLLFAPVYTYFIKAEYTLAVALLSVLIVIKHKSNIVRLLNKQENRFSALSNPNKQSKK